VNEGILSEPPDLAQTLLNPDCYPGTPSDIKLVKTSTSYVFLTGDFAYKIKKPVDPGYLDYTTLDKRHFYCKREVSLNRRLCPDIYLDTVPITEGKDGLSVEGEGKTLEYAVKMKQMPVGSMLSTLLDTDDITSSDMHEIARKLAEFHEKAATSETISDYGDIEFILTGTEENFIDSIRYISKTISQKSYRAIKDYTNSFIENNTELFYERISDSKIRDCHGDLRVKHICVADDIYIFDCIEFNDSLRYSDVASEVAFLAMDLDWYGRTDLSRTFVNAYISITGDEDLPDILDFYKCYRAYYRGRIESMKLDIPDISEEQIAEVTETAGKYFELAESYI
jgi:aminoglycoside phosphotransferase family enzyme